MTLRRRYTPIRVSQPALTLGGRWVRPRPLYDVTLVGPMGTYLDAGLVDPGSDETIFPNLAAARAGIDLTIAPTGNIAGVGLGTVHLRYALVTLRIAGVNELREWRAWVGFTAAPLKRPVLGFAGFLQFFSAHFYGDREEFELEVNSLYPGT
jgi:hypothetical protein